MRKRIRQLCVVQFAHSVMRPYDSQDEERKNYINEVIQSEFQPAVEGQKVSNSWIQHQCKQVMKHRRSECRDAYREGKPKPIWLDAEEWEMIRQEYTDTPEKFSQQREAARVRLASVGSSHLGSGGWGNMQAEFVSKFSFVHC